jgi:hypothetical protein
MVLMSETMQIPAEWMAEAGVENFRPARNSFRCSGAHELIAVADIEGIARAVPIDRNGFAHDRMISVLAGIRDDVLFPKPIQIIRQASLLPYRLHHGVHRYYASLALGFTHVPAEIVPDPRLY